MINEGAFCPICEAAGVVDDVSEAAYLRFRVHQSLFKCRVCEHRWKFPLIACDKELEDKFELELGVVRYGVYAANENGSLPSHLASRLSVVGDGKRLLDFGSGDGTFLSRAIALGVDAWGVDKDVSSVVSKEIRERIKPSLSCYVSDKFDFVHSNHVLEHVDDPVLILRDLHASLKNGGVLLIEVPNEIVSLSTMMKRLMFMKSCSATSMYEHQHFFTIKSLSSALYRAGFSELQISTPRRAFGRWRGLFDFLATLVSRGDVIYSVARKIE